MTINQDLAYHLYQVTHEKFDCSASELSSEQHDEAVRIAKRKMRIEEAILGSSEAGRIAIPSPQVDSAFDEIVSRYGGDVPLFKEELQRVGIDEKFLRQALQRELHVNATLDYIATTEADVSETDVSLYYYLNVNKFNQPETRAVRHILVTINDESIENTRVNALKKIQQIQSRLKKKADRFEEQALKHSECPTALEGGFLGKVKRGILYPEIEEVLFKLNVGQLSDIVESPVGFHIVRCDEIQEAGVVPLEEVKDKLKQHLSEKSKKTAQRNWLNRLLQKTPEIEGRVASV